MGQKVHIAVPGKGRAHVPVHGQVGKPGIGDRDRLHCQGLALDLLLGDREQRTLEGQHPVAVARRALGKQDQATVSFETACDRILLLAGLARPAVDEDCALQLGEPAEQRPARDLGLGHEAAAHQGAQDLDVEVGGVVGHDQQRLVPGDATAHVQPYAEDAANQAVVPLGETDRCPRTDRHEHGLDRHAGQRQRDVEHQAHDRERNDHAPSRPSAASSSSSRL